MTFNQRVVLDSWPVLDAVYGSREFRPALDSLSVGPAPIMSAANFGEVYYSVLASRGIVEAKDTVFLLRERVELELPDFDRVMQATHLKAHYFIALGDGFAAATALHHEAELWTGDPELLFDGSPWRSRDLRPAGARVATKKERSGRIGLKPRSRGRPIDEPDVPFSELMDFLGLSEN